MAGPYLAPLLRPGRMPPGHTMQHIKRVLGTSRTHPPSTSTPYLFIFTASFVVAATCLWLLRCNYMATTDFMRPDFLHSFIISYFIIGTFAALSSELVGTRRERTNVSGLYHRHRHHYYYVISDSLISDSCDSIIHQLSQFAVRLVQLALESRLITSLSLTAKKAP